LLKPILDVLLTITKVNKAELIKLLFAAVGVLAVAQEGLQAILAALVAP